MWTFKRDGKQVTVYNKSGQAVYRFNIGILNDPQDYYDRCDHVAGLLKSQLMVERR